MSINFQRKVLNSWYNYQMMQQTFNWVSPQFSDNPFDSSIKPGGCTLLLDILRSVRVVLFLKAALKAAQPWKANPFHETSNLVREVFFCNGHVILRCIHKTITLSQSTHLLTMSPKATHSAPLPRRWFHERSKYSIESFMPGKISQHCVSVPPDRQCQFITVKF